MNSDLDNAIGKYVQQRTDARFTDIYLAFLCENCLVPVSEQPRELQTNHYDVPIICMRNEAGEGAIPVFTSEQHLVKWKSHGCLYAILSGRTILNMAMGMEEISEIQINPNGVPHGRIPRVDFVNILRLEGREA